MYLAVGKRILLDIQWLDLSVFTNALFFLLQLLHIFLHGDEGYSFSF